MAPNAVFEASVVKIKGKLKSGKVKTGVVQSFFFSFLNVSCLLGPHVNGWSFRVREINGFAISANFGTSPR